MEGSMGAAKDGVTWAPLPRGPFDIVLADPPWDYNNRVQHGGTKQGYTSGASAFYPTATLAELAKLPVRDIATKNALLYLWATGPQLEVAMRLGNAWGFRYATIAYVWDKCMVNPGAYTMSQCEVVLVFKRGSIPKPRGARNVRQMLKVPRTIHSHKPAEVCARLEQMHPKQKKIELFAVEPRKGWARWGKPHRPLEAP
jgi:N6-adenosine-specific RNA methylase IME4